MKLEVVSIGSVEKSVKHTAYILSEDCLEGSSSNKSFAMVLSLKWRDDKMHASG